MSNYTIVSKYNDKIDIITDGIKFGLQLKNAEKEILLDCICDSINPTWLRDFNQVVIGGKLGILTEQGFFLIPAKYDGITRLRDYLYIVEKNDMFGLVNDLGNEIEDCQFTYQEILEKIKEY